MAGDIGIRERAIVLEAEAEARAAEAVDEVAQARGRPMHFYGSRVVIAEVASDAEEKIESLEAINLGRRSKAIAAAAREGLDSEAELGLAAFDLRQTKKYAKAKAARPLAGANWDTEGALPPNPPQDLSEDGAEAAAQAQAPTSTRLTGKVAVGLIIVEGPNNDLKFSLAERLKVVAEVQNGLGWLGSYSTPAGVSWFYDIHVVSLNVQPGSDSLNLSQKEALWRDPAMQKLGYPSGMNGVQKYVEDIRTKKGTNWAYCAFFTKYPLGWFAYASIGGPRLVMAYANDGWGPDNIDRVFAHETGHIFGAPDEYASSNCNCGGQWGYYKQPNGNCANCAPGGGVACIMKSNDWQMCQYTPYHLGFPQETRYSGVYVQGSGAYGLWVNASWSPFVQKWQQWGQQGLRLIDLEITGSGSSRRYSGVWRQGSGGYGLWVNASWSSFIQKWQQWASQGLRLIDLEITGSGSSRRYSGVWVQGSGGYGLWVNASWSSFIQKWQQWASQGLRLIDLEITGSGSSRRYSGVWRQGSGGYGLWVNANWASFLDKWKQWSDSGLRLIDLEITGTGVSGSPSQSGAGSVVLAGGRLGDDKSDSEGAGYGFSTLDASPGEPSEGDAGFGARSIGGGDENDDPGGFGASSLDDGTEADESQAGFGASSLDEQLREEEDEAGFGASSLEENGADQEEGNGAGEAVTP